MGYNTPNPGGTPPPVPSRPVMPGSTPPSGGQPPKKNNTLLWLLPLIAVVVIGGAVGVWFWRDNAKKQQEAENLRRQDSIFRVEEARRDSARLAKEEAMRLDSIRRNMVTPDLAFFELRGNVRTCVTNYIPGFTHLDKSITLEFSEDGEWINRGSLPAPYCYASVGRNAEGYIVKFDYDSQDDSTFEFSFKWSNDKVVKENGRGWEWMNESNFVYSSSGFLSSVRISSADEGNEGDGHFTYIYDSFDDFGNWTRRTCKYTWQYYDVYDYDTRQLAGTDSGTLTDSRQITYY